MPIIRIDDVAFNDATATTTLYDFITRVTSSMDYKDLITMLFQIY